MYVRIFLGSAAVFILSVLDEILCVINDNRSWDKSTRRIGVNARLFDGFDAAEAPVVVIDGKNLW